MAKFFRLFESSEFIAFGLMLGFSFACSNAGVLHHESKVLSSGKTVSFVAIGDAGTGDYNQLKVANSVETFCRRSDKQCDFALYLGDNFYPSGLSDKPDQALTLWQERFEGPYYKLNFPFYVVMGNHDYSTQGILRPNWSKKDIYKSFHRYNSPGDPNPGKWNFPDPWYAFHSGNASFAALDTEHLIYEAREFASQQKVVKEMADLADRHSLDFRIAFGHHPLYSNGAHGNAGSYGSSSVVKKAMEQRDGRFLKLFFNSKLRDDSLGCDLIDIYVSGHDHNQQIIEKENECPGLYVVSGTGGKVTELARTTADNMENKTHYAKPQLGFTHFEITGRDVTITVVNELAQIEKTLSCTKDGQNQMRCL